MIGGDKMKYVYKFLNNAALSAAKTNQNACAIIAFDEPKMPNSMLK